MSDELTTSPALPGEPDRPEAVEPRRGRGLRPALRQAAVIVVVFAIAGVICGFIWEAVWSPEPGEVVKHVWYPFSWDRAMPTDFAGTGWYVMVSIVAGLLLGAVLSWLQDRAELLTLAAMVVGGLLAAYLMRVVGLHRGPGDPQRIAKTAADGTKLPTELKLASWWLLTVLPGAALAGLSVVFLLVPKRGSRTATKSENAAVQPPVAG